MARLGTDLITAAPHAVRSRTSTTRRIVGVIAAGVLAVSVLAGCISNDQASAENLLNSDRMANRLTALPDFAPSSTKAQAWAQRMANNNGLSHSNLTDGYGGVNWCNLGENVGMGPSLAAIEQAFMGSAPHRANILNSVYDNLGTGVVLKGSTYYVVQEFVNVC